MKAAILFSGGKDSTMAIYNALENNDDVKYLLAIKSHNDESYMFHVPNIHITDLLAEAMSIPIITVTTEGIKEKELDDLKEGFIKLKNQGVEAIYTGALYSTYQKTRIERLGEEVGLKIISPYWHVDELKYMRKIISIGFDVVISGVSAYGLDEKWLGRHIDEECISDLIKLNEKVGINLAFEGGEAETLVVDGPIFKKRVKILDYEKTWNVDNGVFIIKKAILEDK